MMRSARGRERPLAALKAWLMRGWEASAIKRFDRAIVVSRDDLARLREIGCTLPAAVIPNGVDTRSLQPLPPAQGDELLFVGTMGYFPNREAVRWMAREILPLIREQRPQCRLTVVGTGGEKHLADLEQQGMLEITGAVPDLLPWYQRSQVAVVPLLSGGGTRLKILEAMALQRPVVSTTLGCEGIELQHGRDVMLADDPRAFARAVLQLLEDRELSLRLARAGRAQVERNYDWDLLSARLLEEYAKLFTGTAP
jgi:glycosyltransferase involved in cell wall biosynthesis